MEPFFLYCIIFSSFLASVWITSLFFIRKSNAPPSHPNLPPGKMGLPIIGENLEFVSAARKGNPQKFIWDRMIKYSSKAFKTSILGQPMVVVCGAEGNKFLFSNENKLVISWFPDSVSKILKSNRENSFGERTKKTRTLLPNFIKPEGLQRYIGVMDSMAQNHFEVDWEGKQQVTVLPLSKKYTFSVSCKVLFGIEDPMEVAKLSKTFDHIISGLVSIPINFPGTNFNRGMKASQAMRKEFLGIIKQRKIHLAENRASLTQDVLSHMLLTTDKDGQYMNEMDIAETMVGLLVASTDTTTSVITLTVKYLAELPHIYNEVLKEQMEISSMKKPGELLNWDDIHKMKYSWNVVCEVMRLSPPGQGNYREAISDCTFAGFNIPKGWKLHWNIYSTHWDPKYFPEPEKFNPARFEGNGPAPYAYVPFGGGPRMCAGKDYARVVILVFMHHVTKRFKLKKLLHNEKITMFPTPTPVSGLPIGLVSQDG